MRSVVRLSCLVALVCVLGWSPSAHAEPYVTTKVPRGELLTANPGFRVVQVSRNQIEIVRADRSAARAAGNKVSCICQKNDPNNTCGWHGNGTTVECVGACGGGACTIVLIAKVPSN